MIVLDTHAWLWMCVEPRRLSTAASAAIRRALGDGGLAIASISLLEVAALVARGRIIPHGTIDAWLDALVDRSSVKSGDSRCEFDYLSSIYAAVLGRSLPTILPSSYFPPVAAHSPPVAANL